MRHTGQHKQQVALSDCLRSSTTVPFQGHPHPLEGRGSLCLCLFGPAGVPHWQSCCRCAGRCCLSMISAQCLSFEERPLSMVLISFPFVGGLHYLDHARLHSNSVLHSSRQGLIIDLVGDTGDFCTTPFPFICCHQVTSELC